MRNYLKVDEKNRRLLMDREFARTAYIVGAENYQILQQARADYKGFHVEVRTIKKNAAKERYSGFLTVPKNAKRAHPTKRMHPFKWFSKVR